MEVNVCKFYLHRIWERTLLLKFCILISGFIIATQVRFSHLSHRIGQWFHYILFLFCGIFIKNKCKIVMKWLMCPGWFLHIWHVWRCCNSVVWPGMESANALVCVWGNPIGYTFNSGTNRSESFHDLDTGVSQMNMKWTDRWNEIK